MREVILKIRRRRRVDGEVIRLIEGSGSCERVVAMLKRDADDNLWRWIEIAESGLFTDEQRKQGLIHRTHANEIDALVKFAVKAYDQPRLLVNYIDESDYQDASGRAFFRHLEKFAEEAEGGRLGYDEIRAGLARHGWEIGERSVSRLIVASGLRFGRVKGRRTLMGWKLKSSPMPDSSSGHLPGHSSDHSSDHLPDGGDDETN